MSEKKSIASIILKLALVLIAVIGIFGSFYMGGNFMAGKTMLLYFTTQSNMWIALFELFAAIVMIVSLAKKKDCWKRWMTVLQFVFTVSITLTGFVFCFVLFPAMLSESSAMAGAGTSIGDMYPMVLLHVFTPIIAIVDFFAFKHDNITLKYKESLWTTIPPIYYLIFSCIGYIRNWNFGQGNYPYFFLNYGSPAGVFGFSNQMPYFMGSFYWIILATLFVLGIACLYIKLFSGSGKDEITEKAKEMKKTENKKKNPEKADTKKVDTKKNKKDEN